MWLVNKPQQQIERVFVRPDVSNYHVESTATRQTRLQSMASMVVDLACSKGTGPSLQLESFLKEFFVQHGNVRQFALCPPRPICPVYTTFAILRLFDVENRH